MLVQTPSKIYKSDFRTWSGNEEYATAYLMKNEEKSGVLQSVCEVICEPEAEFRMNFDGKKTLILFPLYGEVIVNDYYESISAGETLTINAKKGDLLIIKNLLNTDQADFLIFEFNFCELSQKFSKNTLDFSNRNNMLPISKSVEIPNFVGIFDLRSEGFYQLKKSEKSVFALVIQGAFEFQNRLLETRDGLLLWGIEELEFEALSENALVLFMEV